MIVEVCYLTSVASIFSINCCEFRKHEEDGLSDTFIDWFAEPSDNSVTYGVNETCMFAIIQFHFQFNLLYLLLLACEVNRL